MKSYQIKLFSILILIGIICPISSATTIEVKTKSNIYTVKAPCGWDTIPRDTLNIRFGPDAIDIGLYKKGNETYFEGEYIQYIFLPTVKSLNQFSFEQITKDFEESISHTNKQPDIDSIQVVTYDFRVIKEQKCFYVNGTIKSNSKERNFTQCIIPAKFGFLKIIYYSSILGMRDTNSISIQEVLANTVINENYIYTEPEPKFQLTMWHFILAFSIGLIVFALIQYAPKIRLFISRK